MVGQLAGSRQVVAHHVGHAQGAQHPEVLVGVAHLAAQGACALVAGFHFGSGETARGGQAHAQVHPQLQFQPVARTDVAQRGGQPQAFVEVLAGFRVGRTGAGLQAGGQQVGHGLVDLVGLDQVMGQQLGPAMRDLRVGFQDLGDAAVQALPAGPQHGGVGGVLDQRVLEGVDRVGRQPSAVQQPVFGQPRQRGVQLGGRQRQQRSQRPVVEITPDDGAGLRHFLDHRQPVQPRQQRIVQRAGHGHRPHGTGQHEVIGFLAQQARLHHRLRQLFHIQRYAVALLQDVFKDLGRQRLAAGMVQGDAGAVVPFQQAQLQRQRIRQFPPRWFEFGPAGGQQHHAGLPHVQCELVDEAERAGVGPVQVLEEDEHGVGAGQADDLRLQRAQRQFALPLGAVGDGRAAARRGHGQQRRDVGQGGRHFIGGQPDGQQRHQLVEAVARGVVLGPAGGVFDLADDRVQRGVLELR